MILAGEIVSGGRVGSGWLEIAAGRIAGVGDGEPPRQADSRSSGLIAPGLLDLQVNGALGVEVVGGAQAIDLIDSHQLGHGVTSYLPTIITTEDAIATRAVAELGERAQDPSSPVVGVHLEGPFLNPRYRGVHRAGLLRTPSDGVPAYYEHPAVRLVTLAPELPGAFELIGRLVARGIAVSLGHSGADERAAERAEESGATLVTHIFNAMTAIHHRAAGLAGWALADSDLVPCVIPDGLHVEPPILELIRRAAGERVILVTDSSVASGTRSGTYMQGGIEIHCRADGRAVNDDGELAGSTLSLEQGVSRWSELTHADLPDALDAATRRPSLAIGAGAPLDIGSPANLIEFGEDGELVRTMYNGVWI